jgi:acetylglutamate kinase
VDGEFMALFRVCSHAHELAIAKQIVEPRRMGIHLIVAHGQKPYLSVTLFEQYITIVLIQFIDSSGINDEFALKPVAFLMVDFSLDPK